MRALIETISLFIVISMNFYENRNRGYGCPVKPHTKLGEQVILI